MEAFEHIVKVSLEAQGYIVTSNVKFPIRRKTKNGVYQTHGYEVDVIAAKHASLILGSVKSFLDSPGVDRQGFRGIADEARKTYFGRYLIFNEKDIRECMIKQAGSIYGYPKGQIQFSLYAGNFRSGDESLIREHLGKIKSGSGPIQVLGLDDILLPLIESASSTTYLNDPVIMTVKSLMRAGYIRESITL